MVIFLLFMISLLRPQSYPLNDYRSNLILPPWLAARLNFSRFYPLNT
jgi:hypothetical protein